MSGALNVYRVLYHFERNGNPKTGVSYAHVGATAGDENTIKTILSNNGIAPASGDSIRILSVQNANVSAGTILT